MRLLALAIPLVALLHAHAADAECGPRVPAPLLSAADAKDFPSKIGPALSGPLAALHWEMTADEVKAAAPELAKAMYVNVSDEHGAVTAEGRDAWMPFAGGEVQLWVQNRGLESIHLRYPSRAAALKALKAWKAPANPHNAQKFEFWTSGKGGARALLRPDEKGYVVELSSFVPLAILLENGRAFEQGGKPLLGRARADVCMLDIDAGPKPERFIFSATERSSGPLLLEISWDDDKVASYKLYVDYTYDKKVRTDVPRLLEKRFGKSHEWRPSSQGSYGPACLAFGAGPDVIACDGSVVGVRPVTVWTIYVGEQPYL